ncbi:FadR/GntR family transcriptional regulator [Citrobacter freundii]
MTTSLASISETITRDLAMKIIRGTLSDGEMLPGENELAVQYSASRTSVRNALHVLSAKGLLSIQAKRRSTVNPRELWSFLDTDVLGWMEEVGISPDVAEQLVVTRLMFEPNAAFLAAANATARDLAAIEEAWTLMLRGQQQDQIALFEEGDLAFHTALLKSCHNAFLMSIGNALSAAMMLSFKQTQESSVRETEHAVEQHRLLLEAIRLRQGVTARECMRDIYLARQTAICGPRCRKNIRN